jgi:ABC-2 type transport system permease protein
MGGKKSMGSLIAGFILRRIFKKKSSLIFMIAAPLIVGFIVTMLFNGMSTSYTVIGISDLDGGEWSLELRESLINQGYKIVDIHMDEAPEIVINKKASASIVIPKGFSKNINNSNKPIVNWYSFEDSISAIEIKETLDMEINNYIVVSMAAGGYNSDILKEIQLKRTSIEIVPVEGNNGITSSSLALGFLLMLNMLFMAEGANMVLEDKRSKNFMRIFGGPIKGYQIMMGYLMGMIVVGAIQVTLFLTYLKLIFKIELGANIFSLWFILLTFILVSIGLGFAVSVFFKDEKYQAVVSLVITITTMLGGAFFPVDGMPGFVNIIAVLTPQRWTLKAIESIASGNSLLDIRLNVLVIILFGLVFLTIGLPTFKLANEDK